MKRTLYLGAIAATFLALVATIFVVAWSFSLPQQTQASGEGLTARPCNITTQTKVPVGNNISSTILGTSSLRAWARISITPNASSTIFLAFQGAPAVANSGLGLNIPNLNGASSTPNMEIGRNTYFVSTGMVQGLTSTGSTTVMVVECSYTNS